MSFYQQFDESLASQRMVAGPGLDINEFKRMLRDTNPVLLLVTMIVSVLHSVFDFLAFKNGKRLIHVNQPRYSILEQER
jgi:hypothetical protein